MKVLMLIAVCVAFCGLIEQGTSQRIHYRGLPKRPKPKRSAHPIRVRRQAVDGKISINSNAGANVRVDLIKAPDHNVIGQVLATGNTQDGFVSTGESLAFDNNSFGAAIAKEHVPSIRDTSSQSPNANLFKYSVDANAFRSQNSLPNGLVSNTTTSTAMVPA